MKLNTRQKGFTLVELLIVIVVIAILAAITVVAYNGITNRAHDTANQETANQLRTKVTAWQGIKGSYPTRSAVTGGLNDNEVDEAKLDDSLKNKIASGSSTSSSKPIAYLECKTSSPNATVGAQVKYLKSDGSNGTINVGETSGSGVSCS